MLELVLELVEEEDDTFPDEVEEMLPLEPPDDDVLDTAAPPVDVEEPPVEVDPPLEVDETTMLPLDPELPPPIKPPKPPPPKKPPLPPITTGTPPPLPPTKLSPVGIGTGAGWFAIVTIAGAQAVVVVRVVTTRRCGAGARGIGRAATRLVMTLGGILVILVDFVMYDAARGRSATCTAPPPITAPPQAQAHNLAIAIRTDIRHSFVVGVPAPVIRVPAARCRYAVEAEQTIKCNGLNHIVAAILRRIT